MFTLFLAVAGIAILAVTAMAVSPAVQKHFDATNAYLNKLDSGIDGVKDDIEAQNALIAQLQATQGVLTPEDQALLDQIQTRGEEAAAKIDALDALNPPPTPQTA